MGAIANLWQSERGFVAVTLIASATVGLCIGRMTTDQWLDFSRFIFLTYAAGKTVTGAVQIIKRSPSTSVAAGTDPRPPSGPIGLASVLLVVVLGSLPMATACAGSQRLDTLRTTLASVNAARDGFSTWDATHQHDIVVNAASRQEAEGNLSSYRLEREQVVTGFEIVYRLIGQAATLTDDTSLGIALARSTVLLSDIHRLEGTQ